MGFESVFVTDHLLTARQFYSVSFLEPISTLSMVVLAHQAGLLTDPERASHRMRHVLAATGVL